MKIINYCFYLVHFNLAAFAQGKCDYNIDSVRFCEAGWRKK